MTAGDFAPFDGGAGRPAGRRLAEPAEGVPDWLKEPLWRWCQDTYLAPGGWTIDPAIDAAELALKIPLGRSARSDHLLEVAFDDESLFLHLVDFTLERTDGEDVSDLRAILDLGGSVWEPFYDGERWCLTRRVEAGVSATVERAVEAAPERAAAWLLQAWRQVYGRDPNPSGAYQDAVRAVEAAAWRTVVPDDSGATLGKIIDALRAKPVKWEVDLRPNPDRGKEIDPVLVLADTMALIWRSQLDRHGTAPTDLGPREAEAALHVAAALVHLFGAGIVRRADRA